MDLFHWNNMEVPVQKNFSQPTILYVNWAVKKCEMGLLPLHDIHNKAGKPNKN